MSLLSSTTSAQIDIQIEGMPLNPFIDRMLVSAEVDTTLFVPSQFKLMFRGMSASVLDGGGFQLGASVTLQVTTGGAPTPLMTGDITGVELEYGPEGRMIVVRGLDRSHRLMRGTKTMAYPEMTASNVVEAVAAEAGLVAAATATTTVYEWLTQANVSAWTFVHQLAALENRIAYVDPLGVFQFGPMALPEEAPPPAMTYDSPPLPGQLILGYNLIRLRANVTSAEQVPSVTVTGYDPMMSAPVVGLVPSLPSTAQSLDPLTLPEAVAAEVQATPFFDASHPFEDEGAAEMRAESIAADLAGALAELEGECIVDPSILAG